MDDGDDHTATPDLEAREPTVEDLVELCRHLNARGARYIVIGGFAVRAAGYDRRTMDIDLLIEGGGKWSIDAALCSRSTDSHETRRF